MNNFIGKQEKKLKEEILPAIKNLDAGTINTPLPLPLRPQLIWPMDDDLMESMVRAGFRSVFLGIESPNEASLAECKQDPKY